MKLIALVVIILMNKNMFMELFGKVTHRNENPAQANDSLRGEIARESVTR